MTTDAVEPMVWKCPSCGKQVGGNATRCPSCGFTGEDTIELYGDAFPPLKTVIDSMDRWTESEMRSIRRTQHLLRKKFPQLRFHVESVALPEGSTLPTYGFWRLNTAPLGTHETSIHRSWAVLLVVDEASGLGSVSCGYRVSHLIRDRSVRKSFSTSSSTPLRGGPMKHSGEPRCRCGHEASE